jgi:hypothetical protein
MRISLTGLVRLAGCGYLVDDPDNPGPHPDMWSREMHIKDYIHMLVDRRLVEIGVVIPEDKKREYGHKMPPRNKS